jgi:hypothetical protein
MPDDRGVPGGVREPPFDEFPEPTVGQMVSD